VLNQVLEKLPAGLRGQLAKGAAGIFSMRMAMLGLSFVTSIVLARTLGTEGYGTYAYIVAWVGLLAIPSKLGIDIILSREIPKLATSDRWGSIRGLLQWSSRLVLVVSVGIMVVSGVCVWAFAPVAMRPAFWITLVCIPLSAITALRQGSLRGFHSIFRSQLPEYLIQPLLFIAAIGGALYLSQRGSAGEIGIFGVMLLRSVSIAIAFFIGIVFLIQTVPRAVAKATPEYSTSEWSKGIWPFLLISATHVINSRADILMLGFQSGPEAVGIYTVASRGAEFIVFVLMAVNTAIGPKISQCYAKRDMQTLQKIITTSTRAVFIGSVPIALGLIFFGHYFLQVFGTEFVQGYWALRILCIGQLISAGAGSVGLLLDMTGHEKDSALGIGLSAGLNIVLNALLIPELGAEGAAIATASSLIFWNVFLLVRVQKRLGIASTVLGATQLKL
jgi:O-antigen/teichoic acid export membrane protein